MMRLEPPIEVMVGTVSTLTERRRRRTQTFTYILCDVVHSLDGPLNTLNVVE